MGLYCVTEGGHKLPIDDSSIDYEKEYFPFQQTVGVYSDNTVLKNVWILELNSRDFFRNGADFELEFVKEIKYDHKPTQEEILWAMSRYGCTRGSVAFIREGYELDLEFDD